MKHATALLPVFLFIIVVSCNDAADKVYCQGFVTREIVHTADHEEISRTFRLGCNGQCPGDSCAILKKEYNPVQPNGLVKEEWCGCPGDTIPRGCDIILKTYNINGRMVQQADCTPFDSCPVKTDSCQQQNRERVDTLRTVDNRDSIYHYYTTITCECN